MDQISITEFKAKCLAVLDRVHKTKRPIRITHHGKPVAEVVPPSPVRERSDRIGSMKDSIEIIGDLVSTGNEESEWEILPS